MIRRVHLLSPSLDAVMIFFQIDLWSLYATDRSVPDLAACVVWPGSGLFPRILLLMFTFVFRFLRDVLELMSRVIGSCYFPPWAHVQFADHSIHVNIPHLLTSDLTFCTGFSI